jgi:hypothetical protein
MRSQTVLELQAHLPALRSQPSSRLILTALVLPPPGAVDQGAEATVRLRDISLLQLSNERQPCKAEILELITAIRDSTGGLALIREIHASNSAAIAVEVRYQLSNDRGR